MHFYVKTVWFLGVSFFSVIPALCQCMSHIVRVKLVFNVLFQPVSSPTMHQSFAIPALSTASSSSAGASKLSVSSGATSSQNVAAMQHSALKRLQMVKKKAQQRVLNHQQIRIPRR